VVIAGWKRRHVVSVGSSSGTGDRGDPHAVPTWGQQVGVARFKGCIAPTLWGSRRPAFITGDCAPSNPVTVPGVVLRLVSRI